MIGPGNCERCGVRITSFKREAWANHRCLFYTCEPRACTVPPPGWYCTRGENHDGPCAALPVQTRERILTNMEKCVIGPRERALRMRLITSLLVYGVTK